MNLKRGILIGLALYVVTFIVGVILTLIARISLESPQNIPTTYWIITIVITVLLTSLASLWYFNKAKRSAKEGLKLGITFVLVGFAIDLISFMPLFLSGAGNVVIEYYSSAPFYIVLILIIATCVFVGSRIHHTSNKKHR